MITTIGLLVPLVVAPSTNSRAENNVVLIKFTIATKQSQQQQTNPTTFICTMRSFLTTSVLVASILTSSNAGSLKGSKPAPVDSTPTLATRSLTSSYKPGVFNLVNSFLSSAQEVPPLKTATTGTLQVAFDEDFENMAYSLRVDVGESKAVIVQAHFHCGSAGLNGPVFAFLYDSSVDSVKVKDGILTIEGLLTYRDIVPDVDFAADEVCGMPVNTIASVYELVAARKLYVNVHTVKNAGGEIRAQIFEKPLYVD